ncbi:MAG: MFS transporter, partial [Acidobacteriota bacterium]|nr:MFS transporter [Acidobacteriota bacterium]
MAGFTESPSGVTGKTSGWGVLRYQLFKALWIAAVASNLGTWMHEVGAAWLMTSLSSSPLMVSLIQTAATLPVFLIALTAGALADVVDRRRLLLVTQGWMLGAACLLGILTVLSLTTPWALLALTFLLYAGSALNAPAWQAIVPELVPLDEVPAAVALNSVGFNVARAAGPALGGLIVASAGPSAVFFLNSASFVAVIAVLYRWPRPARESALPAERIWGAMRAGIRYARYAPLLQRVLVRAFLFTFFASAVWALMPLVAKVSLGRGAASYGLLLGFMGAGAVLGGSVLHRIQQALSTDKLLAGALVLFAFALFLLGFSHRLVFSCMATALAGIAWTSLLSTLNAIVQVEASIWVRGRALSVYQLCMFGGTAIGSVIWGLAATHS